jgi:succinylglutamate desuccinylase
LIDQALVTPPCTEGDHLIGAFVGRSDGPTLIAIGSLHGNEPAGAIALERVSEQLAKMPDKLNGRVYFLRGNTRAMASSSRYIDADLNRHWTPQNMSRVSSEAVLAQSEGVELTELDQLLDSILVTAQDEVCVLDLHSTSADGRPFATVGDTLRNREFALKFPTTILLGIEEQLEGTLLEYLNNAGAVTLGFEGGSHRSQQTVENHEALVWLALKNTNIIDQESTLDEYKVKLAESSDGKAHMFEVRYRHAITPEDDFVMDPGYNNFDPIKAGQVLAHDKRGKVTAPETGVILMPLYQRLGNDGFFIGREISSFWLWLSAVLRRIGLQKMVHLLPGVRRDPDRHETLIVDTSIARLFPLQVFHLLGFRRRRWSENKLIVSRRKHDAVSPFKKGT